MGGKGKSRQQEEKRGDKAKDKAEKKAKAEALDIIGPSTRNVLPNEMLLCSTPTPDLSFLLSMRKAFTWHLPPAHPLTTPSTPFLTSLASNLCFSPRKYSPVRAIRKTISRRSNKQLVYLTGPCFSLTMAPQILIWCQN